jgi:hypothetical protein
MKPRDPQTELSMIAQFWQISIILFLLFLVISAFQDLSQTQKDAVIHASASADLGEINVYDLVGQLIDASTLGGLENPISSISGFTENVQSTTSLNAELNPSDHLSSISTSQLPSLVSTLQSQLSTINSLIINISTNVKRLLVQTQGKESAGQNHTQSSTADFVLGFSHASVQSFLFAIGGSFSGGVILWLCYQAMMYFLQVSQIVYEYPMRIFRIGSISV